MPLTGSYGDVGAATGHGFGEPTNYHDHSGVAADETSIWIPVALQRLTDVFVRADAALRVLAPEQTPVLWPEHFDVAILLAGTSFGVSPGDDANPAPYAYVSTSTLPRDDFWNAPFGAYRTDAALPRSAALWPSGLTGSIVCGRPRPGPVEVEHQLAVRPAQQISTLPWAGRSTGSGS